MVNRRSSPRLEVVKEDDVESDRSTNSEYYSFQIHLTAFHKISKYPVIKICLDFICGLYYRVEALFPPVRLLLLLAWYMTDAVIRIWMRFGLYYLDGLLCGLLDILEDFFPLVLMTPQEMMQAYRNRPIPKRCCKLMCCIKRRPSNQCCRHANIPQHKCASIVMISRDCFCQHNPSRVRGTLITTLSLEDSTTEILGM